MDGIARGKIINASKFTDLESSTFGFCSVVFGWDMHDSGYNPKTPSMLVNEGFSDLLAKIDMNSFRRCPLTKQAHYLVDFLNPVTREPLSYCPRSLLKSVISKNPGLHAYTGVEFEFYNFKETVESLSLKKGSSLTPLTPGMFGYRYQHINAASYGLLFIKNILTRSMMQLYDLEYQSNAFIRKQAQVCTRLLWNTATP